MTPAASARLREPALAAILLLALAIRLWVLATHTYIVHPDETFQYLEPAHRLAFGSGIITWEFIDGIRSWLLPGLIAAIWRCVALFDDDPRVAIFVLRLLCVVASLSVPYAGYRIAERVRGKEAAWVAGLFCAVSPQAIYFAPVIMTDPLAANCALLALAIGLDARGNRRTSLLAGMMFGLAATLRYQLAPALALAALCQFGRDRRTLGWVVAGGITVVLLGLGGVDAATWGVPFQSVWLNFQRNALQGVSDAMGTSPWTLYLTYLAVSWGPVVPVVLACFAVGAFRAPVLGLLTIAIVGMHTLTPHKEIRFILVAIDALPILVGIGLTDLLARLPARLSGARMRLAATVLLAAVVDWSTLVRATSGDAWHRDRAVLQATAAARNLPEICGLAFRTAAVYRSPGYTHWHRPSPLYFENWFPSQVLPSSGFRLRLENVLAGRTVPQFQMAAFGQHTGAFNAVIGLQADGLPGYTARACFGAGVLGDPIFCVFTRPGGCG